MKILFWLSAIVVFFANGTIIQGFVNIYFKNYNGGPESSGGRSIVVYMILGIVIFIGGLCCYFLGQIKWAALIMGLPILLVCLYMFVMVILPYLMGSRMN